MPELTPEQVLDLPMGDDNGAGAATVRGYLARLAELVVADGDEFSGNRPFGSSGWMRELYRPLVEAGAVAWSSDEWGTPDGESLRAADAVLAAAARTLGQPPALNAAAVDAALRAVVADLDYDLHKSVERDESTGEDTYPQYVASFITAYWAAAGGPPADATAAAADAAVDRYERERNDHEDHHSAVHIVLTDAVQRGAGDAELAAITRALLALQDD
jgi:hypothetical protein